MGGELDQVMNENSKQEENFYSNSDDSSTSSYDVQTNKKTQESDIYGPKRQNTGVSIESTPAVKQGDKTNEYGSPAIFDNGIPRISTGYIFNPKYDHTRHNEFYPRTPNCKNPFDKRGYIPGYNSYNQGKSATAGTGSSQRYPLHENEKTVDVPVDKERVALDSFTADLNIHVESPAALSAFPVTHAVSAWIFGNVRCTHGIRVPIEGPPDHIKVSSNANSSSRRVKCGFEVKIDECLEFDTEIIPRQEHREAHFIRVGWSEVNCQGNLGEERDSIGLDSLGRVLAEGQCFRHEFSKVCCNLRENDVIGAYMEYDRETSQVHFSFRVNDKNLGVLAKIPAKSDETVFVPHILTKNIKFTCNFGTLGAYIQPKKPKKSKSKKSKKRRHRSDSRSSASTRSSRRSSRSSNSSRSNSRSSSRSTFGSSDESEDDFEKVLAKKCPSMLPDHRTYLRFIPPVPALEGNEAEKLDFNDDDNNDEDKKEGGKQDKKARYAPLIGDDFHVSRIVRCAGIVYRETPEKDGDCDVIMVMGLPGCGKTTWINKMMREDEGKYKRFCVIGTETILGRTAILGKPRNFKAGSTILPKTYNVNAEKKEDGKKEDSDMLRVPISHLQTKWLELACTRKRNFILDQLNVFPGTHIKKMKGFDDFNRIAAVIMPADKEYRKRKYKREDELKQEIARKNILELKSGIELPKADRVLFDKILFPESPQEECEQLVLKYREEGKEYSLKRPGRGGMGGAGGRGGYNNSYSGGEGGSVGYGTNTGYVPGRSSAQAKAESGYAGRGSYAGGRGGYGGRGGGRGGYGGGYSHGGGYNDYYQGEYEAYDETYYPRQDWHGEESAYHERSYANPDNYKPGRPEIGRKRPRERSLSDEKPAAAAANPLAALQTLAQIPGLAGLAGLGGLGAGLGAANPLAALTGAAGGAAATAANPLAALSSMTPEQQAQYSAYYTQVYQQYYQQYAAAYGSNVAGQMLGGNAAEVKREQ